MTRSPLFALVLASQACLASFLPDTGLSVHALGYQSGGNRCFQVRLQNLGRASRSDLEMRYFLSGDSVESADFALHSDLAVKYLAGGFRSSIDLAALDSTLRATRPRPTIPGCVKNCQMTFSVALPGIILGPLESFRWDLVLDRRLPSGELGNIAPTHSLSTGDWSFSGIPLDSAKDDPYMEMGSGPLARHIQILSNGAVIWGTAPGETEKAFPSPWKRQGLPTTIDSIKSPYPDSVVQLVRDSANLRLSRVLVNQAGYRETDVRAGRAWIKAIGPSSSLFSVIDANRQTIASGSLVSYGRSASGQTRSTGSNWAGTMSGGDNSYLLTSSIRSGDLQQGRIPSNLPAGGPYRIAIGPDTSATFHVDDRTYGWLRDAELRFFGAQRSGNSESWMHGPSHVDDVAPGGWYDCGNFLKEGVTQAYALAVLGSLATAYPERDADRTAYNHDSMRVTDGIPDLLRELKHGSDFLVGSWLQANRSLSGTINSVGTLNDLNSWFPPDWSDLLPASQGGQASRTGKVDSGASVQANFAAGLAFFAHAWKARDAKASADALELARSLYLAAKRNPARASNSPDYASASRTYASLALAATALLVATRDTSYLRELAYDTSLGKQRLSDSTKFKGGWLAITSDHISSLDYGDISTLALFQFHRMILRDSATASAHGVRSERERSFLELQTGLAMSSTTNFNMGGTTFTGRIPVPSYPYTSLSISFDSLWHDLPLSYGVSGWWNQYQAGNIASLLLYSEMAADLQGQNLPYLGGSAEWNASKTLELALRGLDGLLGVNPWDVSFVLGVGAKNPNHPHFRTGNPDGRTIPFPYGYQTPIGGLYSGQDPATSLLIDSYNNYRTTESCLEGSTNLLVPSMILSTDRGPTTSVYRNNPGASPRPIFSARSTPRGARLEWSGTTGLMEALVIDASGREIARFTSNSPIGSRELVVSRARGPLFVRLRDAASGKSLVLPGL